MNQSSPQDMARILSALDEAASQLEAVEQRRTEPIAIVGLDCRFPGAEQGPDSLWSLLSNETCSIGEIPSDRWDTQAFYHPEPGEPNRYYSTRGGFLTDVDQFDARWFKLSHREAHHMDPQHRLLLESSWNAFENAGIDPASVRNTSVGVFVATAVNEYAGLIAKANAIDAYYGSGNASYAAAGRLAFTFGVHGPCMMIDTACSSSLVALHAACLNLRTRECDTALVGAVNLMLAPEATIALSQARMLSPEGLCKTFDASADGYVRGEGCAALVLKRQSDVGPEDSVWGWIRGSAINHDGPSSGFTVPNGRAQESLYAQALKNATLSPYDIAYLEAHGTGTSLGDPIEMQSIASVYGRERSAPLIVGSVKTNVGHLEAAAGFAGLIKTLLVLREGTIPAHLHLSNPSPHIAWDTNPVTVNREAIALPIKQGSRYAALSSFGASGTNAHVLLEGVADAASRRKPIEPRREFDRRRYWVDENQNSPFVTIDIDEWSTRLTEGTYLSDDEKKLLPKLIASLRGDDPNSVDQWLYQLQWRVAARTGHESLAADINDGTFRAVHETLSNERNNPELAAYLDGLNALDTLTPLFVLSGLQDLGFSYTIGESFTTEACIKSLGVDPSCERLLHRLLEILAQHGAFTHANDMWTVNALTDPSALQSHIDECRVNHPAVAAETELLTRCASQLAAILQKRFDPLPLLFPQDGLTAAHLYQASLGAQVMNRVVAHSIQSITQRCVPGQRIRILEIGAGTGGTTSSVLPALKDVQFEYTYTDISPAFFDEARQKFGDEFCIEYKTFDVESPHHPQGFDTAAYDIILAANVLHTVCDLPATLAHVHSLLAPGGALVLFEGTRPTAWLDLIFGLTEGWWRFNDMRRAANHPLLSPAQWKQHLIESGFALPVDVTPDQSWAGDLAGQSVVVATRQASESTPDALAKTVFIGDEKQRNAFVESGEYHLWPDDITKLDTLASTILAGDVTNIVLFCDCGDATTADASLAMVEQSLRATGERALNLCRNLIRAASSKPPAIWFVTQSAIGAESWSSRDGFLQSLLWGMRQSLVHEHPEWAPRCLDLGALSDHEATKVLRRELLSADQETNVAYHAHNRFVLRMTKVDASQSGTAVKIRPDAWYVITGGRGGIGLQTAQWLIDQGANRIALFGRSEATSEIQEQINQWEESGCTVRSLICDAANEDQVEQSLRDLRSDGTPIRGVIHAAGVLDDALFLDQNWSRYQTVLDAKVSAAWNLHRCTQNDPLDCFVLYSTTTSVFGAPGQSNHAAANQVLDSLGVFRRQMGLPAISINWGPWAQVGEAARRQSEERFESKGFLALQPDQGIRCLERILALNPVQCLAVSIDWERFSPTLIAQPLLSEIHHTENAPSPTQEAVTTNDEWKALPLAKQTAFFRDVITSMIHDILGGSSHDAIDPDQGFFDLGMDSLTAVELRNRIHRTYDIAISSTAALNHPSVNQLVQHILSLTQASPEEETPETDSLDSLNDDELSSLLEQELNQIEDQQR